MNNKLIQAALFVLAFIVWVDATMGQDVSKSTYIDDGRFIVAPVSDTNDIQVYAKDVGQWSKFTFPDGIKVFPVVGVDVCTFGLSGDRITELVAVDRQGNWHTHPLPMAATKCEPHVSSSAPSLAVFLIDGRAYAFSSERGQWDSIPAGSIPNLSGDIAIVANDASIAVFSAKTGKWSVARTKAAKSNP